MEYYMFNGLGDNKQGKSKKKLNKKRVFKVIIIIICIALIVTFSILYTTNEKCRKIMDKYIFRKEVYENNLPTIKIDSNKEIDVWAYNKYISVLEQNKLKIYNNAGTELTSLDIEISSPIFESTGNYLVIAEKDGNKLYLINNKNIVWQTDVEGKITSVNVNKNGYVSIVISGTSYKTVVKVFNEKGDELFSTYLATSNVIDTDISNDNKNLAIAEANFLGIAVQSSIKTISVDDAKNNSGDSIKYTHLADTNDLIININYQNKNELMCMYDTHIDVLNEGQNTQVLNFEDGSTLFADINLSSKIINIIRTSTGTFNEKTEIQIINSHNKNINTYSIENEPKTVYVQDDVIAINLGTRVLFINDNGWLIKEYKSSHEIQEIVLCGNVAGIISKNKIEIVSL